MATFWFAALTLMLAIYVVLDGADFGVGVLHLFVARKAERHQVLESIEPYWDGNEVWLIASGGVLFLAFPRVYAAAFSGFYLALMVVLWLLILRGIAIAFRSQSENPLWRDFWDTIFALASGLLAFVLGATLGNLVRGVPVDEKGYFYVTFFTDFLPGLIRAPSTGTPAWSASLPWRCWRATAPCTWAGRPLVRCRHAAGPAPGRSGWRSWSCGSAPPWRPPCCAGKSTPT